MNKSFYKKSIMAMLFVLIYIAASTAFAQILPLPVLQDLTNSNIERRILYDAIQAAAVIPFAVTYFRDTAFRKMPPPSSLRIPVIVPPSGYLGGLLAFVPYW